jgi:hypothetical protein
VNRERLDGFEDLPQLSVDVPFWWLPVALSWKRQAAIVIAAALVGFGVGLLIGLGGR